MRFACTITQPLDKPPKSGYNAGKQIGQTARKRAKMPSLDTLFAEWQAEQQATNDARQRANNPPVSVTGKKAKTQAQLRWTRRHFAQQRVEQAKLPPRKGKPTMFCDECNQVRESQFVKVVEQWPRTQYVCIVCR